MTTATAGSTAITTNHEEIRRWVEACGGGPARLKEGEGNRGLLRVEFPGADNGGRLESITWDDWFHQFEENRLAFLYPRGADNRGRCKLIRR